MDRREFMTATSLAGLSLGAGTARAAVQATTAPAMSDAQINAAFDNIFQERVRSAPALATSLGLDKGPNAALRATFDPKPAQQARAEEIARAKRALARVQAIPPASLSPAAALNREIVIYDLQQQLTAPTRFDLDSAQSPYVISQQDGAYFSTPDFLNSRHPIDTREDAEAYLSRLGEFGRILDYDTQEQSAKRPAAMSHRPGRSTLPSAR
jgi:uncharacterized protein (DUF885 family)